MRRASGSLFGLAYGDALGKPTEFLDVAAIEARYGPGGPRELEGDPALVTDDTQMAIAVADGLLAAQSWAPEVVEPLWRTRFLEWARSPENDRAPGMTCMRAIAGLEDGYRWQRATIAGSKGCGANMRVTPVGLLPDIDDDTLAGLSQLQAGMTHGHPTALTASELTAYATRVLRDGAPLRDVPALLRARADSQRGVYREEWLGDLWERPGASTPDEYIDRGWVECLDVLDRLDAALAAPDRAADPCLATGAGWIAEEALATALHCALLFPDDPVAALGRAAATSGDSDSIAALAGAFLGAALGMSAWPDGWDHRIEYADRLSAFGAAWD
ncbi:ADP-ribosylglycohydrolase family protein [Luedemannella flava]|uniref:ADP-ribosylglycohydrolase family protein n=1 Tax=Luedemannella flava TaxID=349316 RepID=A0ABN2LIC0_9ACTN